MPFLQGRRVETLHIDLDVSRRMTALLAGLHGFAAAMPWLANLPAWLALAALPPLAGSLVFYMRREALRLSPAAIVALTLHPDCRCEFRTRDGKEHEAELLGTSFVTPYLTVLNLKPAGFFLQRHAVIVPDNVDAETFRKLRVLLKWRCGRL
jgi:toxin CptA